MRAYVRLRLPDGSTAELGHGDLIGRLPAAALHLDDARISEAHALVSLRGESLKLLALRGRFAVDSKPLSEVVLRHGLEILLARELPVVVEELVLPEQVLALVGEGLPQQVLSGTCSILTQPRPQLVPRYLGEARAWIWSSGEDWRLRVAGAEPRELAQGERFEVDGRAFELRAVTLKGAGQKRTQVHGQVHAPLRVVAWYDTVHFHREGEAVLALTGISARLLSELVACGAPVSWKAVAREIWSDAEDDHLLRRKWDIAVSRLRKKLKAAKIRPDLVRPDGTGNIELYLAEGDEVLDRT